MTGNTVLILGGRGKGENFEDLFKKLPKNVIHTVQYFFSTPEVFMKINPLFWSFFQIIRVKFFQKTRAKLWTERLPRAFTT